MIEGTQISYRPALYLRIKKTAGSALITAVQQHYGRENVTCHTEFIARHRPSKKGADEGTALDFAVKSARECSNIPFVSGYFGFDYAEPLLTDRFSFTFLRDPIERILSVYSFCRLRDPKYFGINDSADCISLTDFLRLGFDNPEVKAHIWNHQTWQLASGIGDSDWRQPAKDLLTLATDHLDAFSHIGFAETFEKDRNHVLHSLGIPIPIGRVETKLNLLRPVFNELPKTTRDLLYELTDLDRQLYEVAWSRRNGAARRYTELSSKIASVDSEVSSIDESRNYYLGLLQQCLTGAIYGDASFAPFTSREFDPNLREHGLDWPERAQTMVGEKRLANLRELVCSVLKESVPGDLIETGVWRGGACILMRAILLVNGDAHRKVWVADSFEGLPPGNESLYPADAGSEFHSYAELAVSLEDVKQNFHDYGLLDDQVTFLKGWFKDTLPTAPIDQLALIRLDGDMYESTMDALQALYPKLSHNGYVIVDDYHVVPACKQAVHDYCASIGIAPQFCEIDGVGVYWKNTEPDSARIAEVPPTGEISPVVMLDRLNRALDCLNRFAIRQILLSVSKRDASLAKQQMWIADLSQQVTEGRSSIEKLTRQVADRDASVEVLNRQIAASTKTIAEIHASSSWKLTHSLRVLGALLRKAANRQ